MTRAGTRALVVCDGASVPADIASEAWTAHTELRSRGPQGNLILHGENLGTTLLTNIDGRARDLVHIASYAYAADQVLSR